LSIFIGRIKSKRKDIKYNKDKSLDKDINIQQSMKIVCLSKQKFKLLHQKVQGYSDLVSCSIAGVNSFGEMQILSILNQLE